MFRPIVRDDLIRELTELKKRSREQILIHNSNLHEKLRVHYAQPREIGRHTRGKTDVEIPIEIEPLVRNRIIVKLKPEF